MPTPRIRWRRRAGLALYYTWVVRTRIGRRGAALIVIGFVWILRGIALLQDPPFVRETETAGHEFLQVVMPFKSWGVLWIVVGCLALAQSFAKKKDWHAFAAIQGITFAWASGLTASYIFTGGNRWVGALTWTLVLVFVQVIAGWPEFQGMTRSWKR